MMRQSSAFMPDSSKCSAGFAPMAAQARHWPNSPNADRGDAQAPGSAGLGRPLQLRLDGGERDIGPKPLAARASPLPQVLQAAIVGDERSHRLPERLRIP